MISRNKKINNKRQMDCFSVATLLTAWTIPHLVLPIHVSVGNFSVNDFACTTFEFGTTRISENVTNTLLDIQSEANFSCTLNVSWDSKTVLLNMGLQVPPGQVNIATTPFPGTCNTAVANLIGACGLDLKITQLDVVPPTAWVDDLLVVAEVIVDMCHTAICDAVSSDLAQQLVNHTLPPPALPPHMGPGITPLENSGLFAAIVNIVNNVPVVFGLRLNAHFVSGNTVEIDVDIKDPLTYGKQGSPLELYVPGGSDLKLQVTVRDLVCSDSLSCLVPAHEPVKVLNLRLRGMGNDVDRLFDNVLLRALEDLLNALLIGNASSHVTSSSSGSEGMLAINIPKKVFHHTPPFWFATSFAALLGALAVAIIAYSANRHTHYPVVDANGTPISTVRIIIEDCCVVMVCFGTIYMFAWSNSTTAGEVLIGGQFSVYSFALANTVHDLWEAGLVPLSFFVCLFSGVYPYFKLLSVVVYSVILQRPQSRTLRFIDALGKFSLMDTFVMMIMVTGLEVNGIATVNIHPSFYVFVTATLMSILVGNYATHGWRRETSVDIAAKQELLLSDQYVFSRQSSLTFPEKNSLSAWQQWQWKIAIPSFALMLTYSILSGMLPSLAYNIEGIAVLVTGAQKEFTLFQLFEACDPYVTFAGSITLMVAPVFYALTYPHCRFLAAWCAPDAFLLACIAGLIQLEQFITFILGAELKPIYSAHAALLWPLSVMVAGMLVLWILIGKELFRIRCFEPAPNRATMSSDLLDETIFLNAKKTPLM